MVERASELQNRHLKHQKFDTRKICVLQIAGLRRTCRDGIVAHTRKVQTRDKAFIVGQAQIDKETEQARFPKDKAAGVGILLSKAAQQKLLSFGSISERVCYARLEGPVCNILYVGTYFPHRGRVCPDQDDTIADLHEALKKAQPGDCIVLMGDLNEQLGPNIPNRTGRWTGGKPSKNAQKILDLILMCQ